jgi:phosphatidylglycerol:prolipoprotein diacylglycerol transferase
MKTMMIIDTTHGGEYFSLAFLLAFLISGSILIYHGIKKDYPLGSWMLILASSVVFFIIGDKASTFSMAQWGEVFTKFRLPEAVEKNGLGGILGMLAGIWLAKVILGFNRPVFNHLAIAIPLSLAVSRAGCFLAGCCFGTPTDLPAGISYGDKSMAYYSHLNQGLIDFQQHASIAIHPVQVYQLIGCLLVAFLVWRTRKFWKADGNLFLFSILSYGFMRFFMEFLVDPASSSYACKVLWDLNLIQCVIILAFVPGIMLLVIRESRFKPSTTDYPPINVQGYRQGLLILLMGLVIYGLRNWFDVLELTTILMFFVPVLIVLAIEVYHDHSVPGFRWALPAILICSISFMAQKSNKEANVDEPIIFTDAGLIGMFGSYYENLYEVIRKPDGCGDYYNVLDPLGIQKVEFWQAGLDISSNKWKGKYNKFAIGGRMLIGTESGQFTIDYPRSQPVFEISPYVNFNYQYVGFGGGFTLGQMKFPFAKKDINSYNMGDIVTTDFRNLFFLPSFSFRGGPVDIIYVEGAFPGFFPSTSPYPLYKVGLGSGLGQSNGTKFSIGICDGIYAELVFPIKNLVVLEAVYADNLASGTSTKRIFCFGIHYRFPTEEKSDQTKKINAN